VSSRNDSTIAAEVSAKDWHTANNTNRDEDAKLRDECQTEIDDLFKRITADQAEYDKQLLTLSSGFLAVSLAFIKDIVHLPEAQLLFLLYLAFMWFGLCIMLVLFSYQFSISVNLRAKVYWENRQVGRDSDFPYRRAELVKHLNRISGILFAFGVSCVVTFVIFNLHREAHMARTTDGAYIKTPGNSNPEDRGSLIKAPAKPAATPPKPSGGNSQSKK